MEPAIFGTLLERALDPRERSKLGAHYTPRAYVERLVVPTIIEPLRADWELVQGQVKELRDKGDHAGALVAVKAYHHMLCTTRVLDPACGTGNFLYVSLELMKRLEGEVLEALDHLGEEQGRFTMEGETVNPRQFYGLELNPRAVPIADLVLWIGYLKWQLKTSGLGSITEPILHAYGTIKQQDAVITYDRQELMRDAVGKPLSRWDGLTKKLHPITGEEVPDPDAQVPLYRYVNPKKAPWPEADFIVGNPPFIGTRRIRLRLGDGYVDALRAAYPDVVETADLVTYWWQEAARRVATGQARRLGLITTNSISQAYNRPVLSAWLDGQKPRLQLSFAVADHPWVDEEEGAAVRIAMTVGVQYTKLPEPAKIGFVVGDDAITLKIREVPHINSRLHAAASTASVRPLLSNGGLCFQGVVPAGSGFKLDALEAAKFPEQDLLKKYLIGRDLTQFNSQTRIIDAFHISLEELRARYPATYQHLLERVLPEREHNNRESYRRLWWVFAEPRPAMRAALASLSSFIGTPYTSKHRIFTIVEGDTLPDAMVYAIAVGDTAVLASLSGRVHIQWALAFGGTLEDRPRYNNSQTFDPFAFPRCLDPDLPYSDPHYAQQEILRELGNRLVNFRKDRLSEHSVLTMTGLYNALERLRELDNGCDVPPLTDVERDVHNAGLVSVLKEIHDDIDRAVLTAYGWEDLIPALVGRPGATLPTLHKTEAQQQAEEELLTRLVTLNQERAAEEKRGLVRWLRPDYQIPKLGAKAPRPDDEHVGFLDIELPDHAERPKWPSDGLEQIRLVRDLLAKAPAPTPPDALASSFDGRNTSKRRDRVEEVLETLVATGLARTGEDGGQRRYFLPR